MNDQVACELLHSLVSIPSVSGNEAEAAAFFAQALRDHGFDACLDDVGNVVASIGAEGPRVALLGHIDTVPGEVPVRIEGDKLFGRGSVDAKGCLVAFAAGAARAAKAGKLAARVELIACVEEEVASSKGAHHAARLPAPDFCIIGEPSHWDRLTLGYKGFVRARARISRPLEHTAAAGRSAAAQACVAYGQLELAAEGHAAGAGGEPKLWDQLLLHLDGVRSESDGLRESAELELRLRLPPDLPPEAAEIWLQDHLPPEFGIEISGGLPAFTGERTSELSRGMARAIRECGGRASFQRKTGTADLNVVGPAWGCPILAYGPGDSALDHTPNEHLELSELRKATYVLSTFLCKPPVLV